MSCSTEGGAEYIWQAQEENTGRRVPDGSELVCEGGGVPVGGAMLDSADSNLNLDSLCSA